MPMTIKDLRRKKGEQDQLAHLREKVTQVEAANQRLHRQLGSQKEFLREIKSAVVAADPFPRFHFKTSKDNSRVSACLIFSDWHIGEQISKSETEGFGQYNSQIAEARIFFLVGSFLAWIETQRSACRIDECAIAGIGDYISGDIHRELSVTNEFPVPVQTAKAGLLFGECVRRIAAHFKLVKVYEVGADNHGRLTMKGHYKQKAENNMSHLVHVIGNAHVDRCKNVTSIVAPGIKYLATIAGKRFLLEHGDTIKSWMGVPYYGMERLAGREARRRMGSGKNFDYQVIGHWHVPALISGNIIVNGSLSGTSEFDHAVGRYADPAQVAFLVHPKHGVFNLLPFKANGAGL